MAEKSILIVEDDELLLGLEKDKITQAGYRVYSALNSVQTFEILQKEKIDLILLDLLLSESDGFLILEEIRKNPITTNIPIIIFSNLSEEKDINRTTKFKINEFIVKSSVTLLELTEKIKKLLG